MVTVDEGQVLEVVHRNIDVLRWAVCRVDLNECETQEECLDRVRQTLEGELDRAENRPIAVRLILEGVTPLHGHLHERATHWMEEFRGIAASLIEVWLEKILLQTRKKAVNDEIPVDGSPLSVLTKAVEELKLGSALLLDLNPEFEQLRTKLPPDLLSEEDPFTLGEEEMEALSEDVKELLMGKILQQEGRRHED